MCKDKRHRYELCQKHSKDQFTEEYKLFFTYRDAINSLPRFGVKHKLNRIKLGRRYRMCVGMKTMDNMNCWFKITREWY